VRAIWMFGTGSYGRNGEGDATADAAVLSQHLRRPVRVQYMRPRRDRWQRQGDRLREHRQGVLAPRHLDPRGAGGRRARRPSARPAAQAGAGLRDSGRFLHVRSRAARLGDRGAPPGSRLAAAQHPFARPLRPADPVRQRPIRIRSSFACNTSRTRATATRSAPPPSITDGTSAPRRARVAARMWRSGAASRSGGTSTPSSR
jgi:hypothetical protein